MGCDGIHNVFPFLTSEKTYGFVARRSCDIDATLSLHHHRILLIVTLISLINIDEIVPFVCIS